MTELWQEFMVAIETYTNETGKLPSIPYLQRRFRLNYMTARHITDALESWGYIERNYDSPNNGFEIIKDWRADVQGGAK